MDELVAAVLASRKYRGVHRRLVERLAADELRKPTAAAEKVGAVRGRLHQAVCAYQVGEPRYDRWLAALRRAEGDSERLKAACLEAMRGHASTRERLPFLERFYREVMPAAARTVVDVGCGLNPLAIPWMGLPAGARYRAYDVVGELVAFLNAAFPLLGVDGRAEPCDVAHDPSCLERGADVALLLKLLPCLEQVEPGAGERLLGAVDARRVVVSFPTRSLGGARKGMGKTYQARFGDRLGGCPIELPGELVFVVER
ncbi:MAG TPA: 16S rRNA methyltransferase [Chloroflexota bacterium]|nr:16S rRNA methyltransferase [Chloroflexota bacterium]